MLIAGLGILKGAQEGVCGLQKIDLTNDTIKILGIHFSFNKRIQTEGNYLITVKKIQKALNVWITRTLSVEGKILSYKTLGISKIVNLSLIITVLNSTLQDWEKFKKFRKHFYGTLLSLKYITRHIIKHSVIHLKTEV